MELKPGSMPPRIIRDDESGITIRLGLPYDIEEVRAFIREYDEPRGLAGDFVITLLPCRPIVQGRCLAWVVDPAEIVQMNAAGTILER